MKDRRLFISNIFYRDWQEYNGRMHKLIILVESTSTPGFHDLWPRFLHAAENIPGLRREATSRISQVLYGDEQYALVHELYFDSYAALQSGLASTSGQEAGRLLQDMTGGKLKLLIADHSEDDLENIRKYRREEQDASSPLQHS
ncbi:MAG: hypothetical protein A2Z71_04760 [Chloroflexi bacterium RBG_13_50_21]|nr:MAG: hypothetical protein A2Z71_04760 [Chloroflexi bacterium RBG_13_50_21]